MKNSYQSYPQIRINGNLRIIEEIYISPLGHLMVKFYDEKKKMFNTFNLGLWEDVLKPIMENKMDVFIKDEDRKTIPLENIKL